MISKNLPIDTSMIIPSEIDFDELALEILDLCPTSKNEAFIDGYIEFTIIFMKEIEFFWRGAFGFPGGSFRFEPELNSESVTDRLNIEIKYMDPNKISDFKEGALLAEVITMKKLLFYLKPDNKRIA